MADQMKKSKHKRNALEDELLKKKDELNILREEFEGFSHAVSHDLRAPLHHIRGYSSLLRESLGDKLSEEECIFMDTILSSVEKIDTLLLALSTFSKLARVEMYHIEVSLAQLVDEIVYSMKSSLKNRTIQWDIGPLPLVLGDPVLLRQALTHLIENAVKYTKYIEDAQILIHQVDSDSHEEIVIRIKDNGVGFNMDYAKRLFQVFQCLHDPEKFDGLGVSLSNVCRIVSRHGGRIWANSKEHEWTEFYLAFPG